VKVDPSKYQITLSVGEIVRLVSDSHAKASSPSFNLRGKLGSDAHRNFQNNRKNVAGYSQEVHLDLPLVEADPERGIWGLRLRGRLDGLIQELDRLVVEEIKTVAMAAAQFAQLTPESFPRHVRQVELYLYLLSRQYPERELWGRLIYINLASRQKKAFDLAYSAEDVEPQVEAIVNEIIAEEIRRIEEIPVKKEVSAKLKFPFPNFRPGQDEMVARTEQCLEEQQDILIEAPTGIGKTAAVLFATLKFALQNDKQIMFLTSKNTQQALVFDTALRIRAESTFSRILWLRSKEKQCLKKDLNCNPELCEYLEDFNRRFRQQKMLEVLLEMGSLTPEAIAEIGRERHLCPYELQQTVSPKFDLIVGDYNYAFDPSVRSGRVFDEGDPSRLILVVDEAHNLPDRARSYYSASLKMVTIALAMEVLQESGYKGFGSIIQQIAELIHYYSSALPNKSPAHPVQLVHDDWLQILERFEERIIPYWYHITESGESVDENPVILLYRQLQDFIRVLGLEGEHLAHIVRKDPEPSLEIICLDASPYLRETFSAVHSGICMSATLSPLEETGHLLGLSKKYEMLKLASPFPPENVLVRIDASVTTLYRQRAENIAPIARRIERFCALSDWNVIAFFPSFELMRQVIAELNIPDILVQESEMTGRERLEILEQFKSSQSSLLCCVMGGIFAEGIDLPGKWAEAAIIVGVGLPAICLENDLLRAYFERKGENGFNFAYLFPGMQRGVQAAGRIVRTPEDKGVILLLDKRYTEPAYRKLLPDYWFSTNGGSKNDEFWDDEVERFIRQK